jgi:hypothetical protein
MDLAAQDGLLRAEGPDTGAATVVPALVRDFFIEAIKLGKTLSENFFLMHARSHVHLHYIPL